MAQDAGQAGDTAESAADAARRFARENIALTAQVGQLTRTLRIRESDLAAMLDREREMAAQVAALTAENRELRGALAAVENGENPHQG